MNTGKQLKGTLSLAIVGLVSAVLTLFVVNVKSGSFSVAFWGGIFGLVISVYLALTDVSRRFWAAARFVVVCCGAFFSSFVVTYWVALNLDRGSMSQDPHESPVAFFVGGSLGAFLVLSEALFLLHPEVPWKLSLLRGLCWSPVGGVLGAIGAVIGGSHFFTPLFLAWQTGMGALIGFLAARQASVPSMLVRPPTAAKTIAAPSARRLPIAYTIFFVLFVGVFSYFAIRDISTRHAATVRQRRITAAMASAPSATDLPELVPVPLEQALVLQEIVGNGPVLPFSRPMAPVSSNEPPTFNYSVSYQKTPMATQLDFHPVVSVFVTQYPNAEWANYHLNDVPVPNAAFFNEKYIHKVKTFGKVIYEDSGWRSPGGQGDLYYYWASGQYLITVIFRGPEVDDQFLQVYLEKYPNSS